MYNIVKHHRRPDASGALHGAARADMAINTGQLGVRVNRMIGFEIILIVMLLQQRDGVAQILNRCGHDVLHGIDAHSMLRRPMVINCIIYALLMLFLINL